MTKTNKFALLFLMTSLALLGAAQPSVQALPAYAFVDGVVGHGQALPLSCESRSAADIAGYWGISIDEVKFFKSLPTSDNPNKGFVGSVYGSWGQTPPNPYGVHAKPIAKLLRQYGLEAQAQFGMSFKELKQEIASGRPVLVWVVGHVWQGTSRIYTAKDGEEVLVAPYEHSMIAYGYDSNNVYLIDAGNGIKAGYAISTFKTSWGVLGNMAVTAQGDGSQPPPPTGDETYVVQPGDYLSKLAQEWGISWQDLAALNNIVYPYIIYPGQILKTGLTSDQPTSTPKPTKPLEPTQTPSPTTEPTNTPEESQEPDPPTQFTNTPTPTQEPSPTAQFTSTPTTEWTNTPRPTLVPLQSYSPTPIPTKTPKPTSKPPKQPTTYTVQRGEYLTQIAANLNLDWKELAQLNGLSSPYTIHPGQVLKLPGSNSLAPEPAPAQNIAKPGGEKYTVKKGDHLMQIARNLELNWKAIAELNRLTYPYALYPGDVLKLPGSDAGPPPPPISDDSSSKPEPEPAPSYSGKYYTVQKGDYLYELARRLGINWQTLASLNGISYPYIIYPGQVLKLPK